MLPVTSWSDISIGVTVPAGTPAGPHQLKITAGNGQRTVNGLTFHVLGGGGVLPSVTGLDSFNRANANTLGGNWSQTTLAGASAIRVNANQAYASDSRPGDLERRRQRIRRSAGRRLHFRQCACERRIAARPDPEGERRHQRESGQLHPCDLRVRQRGRRDDHERWWHDDDSAARSPRPSRRATR